MIPLIVSIFSNSSFISYFTSFVCSCSYDLIIAFASEIYFSTISTTFFSSVLSIPAILSSFPSSLFTYSKLLCPVVAVILRVPEAIPLSDSILKSPISPVDFTWAPPHSSIENSGISTTLTTSPYLSENSAIAPLFFAS